MEELPKINGEELADQDELMRELMREGTMTQWLDKQLRYLSTNNPMLYKHIMSHTQKFAIGVAMAPDQQSIAISLALEQIMLLRLIGNSYKANKELKEFEDKMTGWFGNGIEGLDGLDKPQA